MKETNRLKNVLEYILDSAHDDFYFYCEDEYREGHVYFDAYSLFNGELAAKKMLSELRKDEKNRGK